MTSGETSALDLAARRLERAVAQLEQRLAAKAAAAPKPAPALAGGPDLFGGGDDAQRLRVQLDAAREREKALEEAGAQASVALGRAIAEIRAALGDESIANENAPASGEGDDAAFEDEDDDYERQLFDEPEKG